MCPRTANLSTVDELMDNKTLQTFVVGVYGSGKTTLARQISRDRDIPCVAFDKIWKYGAGGNQCNQFLQKLPENCVTDAIPFHSPQGEGTSYASFYAYAASNEVEVVLTYCSNLEEWIQRVRKKQFFTGEEELHLRRYRTETFGLAEELLGKFGDKLRFYDSYVAEFTDKETFFQVPFLNQKLKAKQKLQAHLQKLTYDKNYQDISCLGRVGYSESWKTWDRIRGLVGWKDQVVVDLGCFHAYFLIKACHHGAKGYGLDISDKVLETAAMINELTETDVTFQEWKGGDEIPDGDIILCLNVLHHFANPVDALSKFKAPIAIFEVKAEQRELISQYYRVDKVVGSHRKGRTILLCTRL